MDNSLIVATYGAPIIKLQMVKESREFSVARIATPSDVVALLAPLASAPEEHFVAVLLDARHNVTGVVEVSHGTLSSSLVHPREVFKAAILANAYAIIVAHNHPAGSMVASSEDLATTKQLVQAGEMLGVPVLDHCIIAGSEVFSIRENYPTYWN